MRTLVAELRVWFLACPKAAPGAKVADLVFPAADAGFESAPDLLRYHLRPALRRAGLREVRFHDLRHTTASLLLAAGVPIKQVQAQLGHATAQITLDVYGHLMPNTGSPGAAAFETRLNGDSAVPKRYPEGQVVPFPGVDGNGSEEAPKASGTGS